LVLFDTIPVFVQIKVWGMVGLCVT